MTAKDTLIVELQYSVEALRTENQILYKKLEEKKAMLENAFSRLSYYELNK